MEPSLTAAWPVSPSDSYGHYTKRWGDWWGQDFRDFAKETGHVERPPDSNFVLLWPGAD